MRAERRGLWHWWWTLPALLLLAGAVPGLFLAAGSLVPETAHADNSITVTVQNNTWPERRSLRIAWDDMTVGQPRCVFRIQTNDGNLAPLSDFSEVEWQFFSITQCENGQRYITIENSTTGTYRVAYWDDTISSPGDLPDATQSFIISMAPPTPTPTPTPIPPTPTPTPVHSPITITTATLSIDSAGANTLNLTWPAQSNLPNTTDWYYYLRRGSATGTTVSSGKFADDSPNLTTAAIALAKKLTAGEKYYVRILPYSNTPWNSQGFKEVTNSAGTACQTSDLTTINTTGFAVSFQGTIADDACQFGGTAANVYKLRLTNKNDVTFTFAGTTAFGPDGNYQVQVRNGGLTGNVVYSGTGRDTIRLKNKEILGSVDYVVIISRTGEGGGYGWSMSLQYGYIDPPTPTPPIQPGQDCGLTPNPAGVGFTVGQTYEFTVFGCLGRYPMTVKSANVSAAELSATSPVTCSNADPDSAILTAPGASLYIRACEAGKNSDITLFTEDGLPGVPYNIYIGGGAVPTPVPPPAPGGTPGGGGNGRDLIGLSIVVGLVCDGVGVGCNYPLIRNVLVTALAVGAAVFVMGGLRGRAGYIAVGLGTAVALAVMFLGHLLVAYDVWIIAVVLAVVLGAGGLMGYARSRGTA